MSKSRSLRVSDFRALVGLCGECRELGDDGLAWRDHAIARLADLVRADMGCTGDMGGCKTGQVRDLGVTFWGRNECLTPTAVEAHMDAFRRDPQYCPSLIAYHRRNKGGAGACLTREDFLSEREWYVSVPRSPVTGAPRTGSALKVDPHHAFPDIVDNFAGDAQRFSIPTKGPGGVVIRQSDLYQLEGSLRGKPGNFEWVVDQGAVTHRRFIPRGQVTGFPNQVPGAK